MFRRRRLLLQIGMAAPVLAFVAVAVAALAYPGFDNARQYISDLGGPKALHPEIFNGAILITGVGAIAAGMGFGLSLVALGGSRIAAALTSLSFALAGVGMVLASYYPWPDPRHLAINLGLGIQLAPVLLLWGEADELIPVRYGEAAAAAIPGSELVALPGVGHIPSIDAPRDFVRLITDFAAGRPATR